MELRRFLDGAEAFDAPLLQMQNPVAHVANDLDLVRYQHDGHPIGLMGPFHQIENVFGALAVQRRGGLIQKQDLGIRDQGTGNGNPCASPPDRVIG